MHVANSRQKAAVHLAKRGAPLSFESATASADWILSKVILMPPAN